MEMKVTNKEWQKEVVKEFGPWQLHGASVPAALDCLTAPLVT